MTGLVGAHRVADAVLYEGYLLYPYRASAAKNQVRWQFGVLGPPGAADAGVGEATSMETEVALEAGATSFIDVYLRFLHVQSRTVECWKDGGWQPVDELTACGTRWIPFHEATPREVPLLNIPVDALEGGRELTVSAPAGRAVRGTAGGRTDCRAADPPAGRAARNGHALQPARLRSTVHGARSRGAQQDLVATGATGRRLRPG